MKKSSSQFYVDIDLAMKYGLDESLIIQFLLDVEFEDLTRQDLAAQFPFWTAKEIRTRVDNLVKKGILIKQNIKDCFCVHRSFYSLAKGYKEKARTLPCVAPRPL